MGLTPRQNPFHSRFFIDHRSANAPFIFSNTWSIPFSSGSAISHIDRSRIF
jgi:hypothetical protein